MSRRDFLTFLFVLALVFIFKGEPDLWDMAHAWAMNYFKVTA